MNSNVRTVGILREATHLRPYFSQPELLANYITTLGNDHNELVSLLAKIYEAHSDKSGKQADGDEMMLAFRLGSEYSLFGEKVEAVISPTIAHINAMVAEAEKAYLESQQNTDKNVVSDVEYKEVTTSLE